MATVLRMNITPVKGLGLQHPESIDLTEVGPLENRRFVLSSGGMLFNGKDFGPIVQILPVVEDERLSLRFPDGEVVTGPIELGQAVETDIYGRMVAGHLVVGPFAAALSEFAGAAIQLVHTDRPGVGNDVHVGTIVTQASCDRLGEELHAVVDARRFRMLLELGGAAAHEEDTWNGRRVQIGEAVVQVLGPVPRCAVTTQDPDTGAVTLDTLRGIRRYRGVREGKLLDFGVYFDVVRPGRISIGDPVEIAERTVA